MLKHLRRWVWPRHEPSREICEAVQCMHQTTREMKAMTRELREERESKAREKVA